MKKHKLTVVDPESPTGYRVEERVSECPVTLVVWFDGDADYCPPLLDGQKTWHGLPLQGWFRWAIDYVSAADERAVAFGPFSDAHEALRAYEETFAQKVGYTAGFRLINDHCLPYQVKKKCMWTDG